MDTWQQLLIKPDTTILESLKTISSGTAQIVLVVGERNTLLGTVTDGDIRQGILRGHTLHDPVNLVMNSNPIHLVISESGEADKSKERLIELMVKHRIHQIPLINQASEVIGLQTIDELLQPDIRDNLIVIMSGGLGKRLLPLTSERPKPMLAVGGKPLLEVNINNIKKQGFHRFCITVGYKADVIKSYFGNGEKWGVTIDYIHEEFPLGTAGALRFLEGKEKLPIIVMNGDLITTVKLVNLIDFHDMHDADCTVCIREFEHQLPYGVVNVSNQDVLSIVEKPTQKYYVNAGMYVIAPSLVSHIPLNECYHMPTLIEQCIHLNKNIKAFPLMEYWSDIGQLDDYEKACREFDEEIY